MGVFDDLGATVSSAADSVSSTVSDLETSAASALDSVTDSVSGALTAVGSFLKTATAKTKFPIPNPLFNYASYTYSIGISALTTSDYNSPDSSYMAGKRLPLICKSGNADPSNRVNTLYGKSDFFVDNLEINSLIGNEKGNNSNATKMTFDIMEPYSMGLFMISLQQAAEDADHPNWHDAPFLLSIQFRGNTETGQIVNIPNTSRYIPFTFTKIDSNVTAAGTVYHCTALPYNATTMNKNHSTLKNDISISGKTVQEMLQTGKKSLQAALNEKAKEMLKEDPAYVPDEYIILFPAAVASGAKSSGNSEAKSSATANPKDVVATDKLLQSIGVTTDSATGLMIQDAAACNALGKAQITFSTDIKGDSPSNEEKTVVDDKGNVIRGKNVINFKESDFRFGQNTDVFNAINQTLLQSQFPGQTLDPTKISKEGYKGWWRIEVQQYIKPTKANFKKTGTRPKIHVFRVIPYDVHISKVSSINVEPYGVKELARTVVKDYQYIYTGKNVDIIKFNIDYSASYYQKMGSDGFRTLDEKARLKEAAATEKESKLKGLPDGAEPSKKSGSVPGQVSRGMTDTPTDNLGGGSMETSATRAARMFHNAITEGTDTQRLTMDIIGDPYYIAQSGTGVYVSKPDSHNLNKDGTINYQSGEVDISVTFRSPSDLNQSTGLFNIKSTPILGYSGLYYVIKLVNHFKNGVFTQTLECLKRHGSGATVKGTKEQGLNTKTPQVENNAGGDRGTRGGN